MIALMKGVTGNRVALKPDREHAQAARQALPERTKRPRRLARPRTPPFHGDNTGSNPVGDANQINNFQLKMLFPSFLR